MPIYEYRCTGCGFEKEYLQKVSDPRITECPSCGRQTFVKKLTAAGFHLKGSGWYATDFKNQTQPKPQTNNSENETKTKTDAAAKAESGGKDAAPAKSDAASAEAKSEAKKEAKKEAKTETKSDAPAGPGSSSS